jgi:hypothetical protein
MIRSSWASEQGRRGREHTASPAGFEDSCQLFVVIGNSAQSFPMTLGDVEISHPAVSRGIRLLLSRPCPVYVR